MQANSTEYVPALTGLRGIAAWWVVVFHFSEPMKDVLPSFVFEFVRNGYLAVDLFFILSGYVIYLTSSQSLAEFNKRKAVQFWIMRLIRIYPLHLVVMTLYLLNPLALWLFSESGNLSERYEIGYFFASLFLVQNWGMFPELKWNIPAWSISTEFAAYLFCPLMIVIITYWRKRTQSAVILTLLGSAIAVAILFLYLGKESIGDAIPSLGVVRCILEFLMGVCLGVLCSTRLPNPSKGKALRSIGILFALLLIVFLSHQGVKNFLFIPLLFTVLIYLLVRGDGFFSPMLAQPMIHYLGLISYSTYLAHYFVKDWVKFLSEDVGIKQFFIYLVLCLLVSHIFYKFIELPSQKTLKRRILGVQNDR